MFEKEAEEYIKEHTFFDEEFGAPSLDVVSKTIFEDGAEFGYNKCKKQAKELLNEFMRISVASVEEYDPEFSELIRKAEQFVNEAEK